MNRRVHALALLLVIAACEDDRGSPTCAADAGALGGDSGPTDAAMDDAGSPSMAGVLRGATLSYDCSGSAGSVEARLRFDEVTPSRGIAGAFDVRANVVQAMATPSPTSGIDPLQIDMVDISCLARFREIAGGARYLELACNSGAQLGPMFMLDLHGAISDRGLLTREVGLAAATTNGLISCDPQATSSARASYSFTFAGPPGFAIVNDVVNLGG